MSPPYTLSKPNNHASYHYRGAEFMFIIALLILSLFLFHAAPPYIRPLPSIKIPLPKTIYALDPSLNFKYEKETITDIMLVSLSYGLPLTVHAFDIMKRRFVSYDTRDFILSLFIAATLNDIITTFVKTLAGGLRPCFYDMCGWDTSLEWDGISNLCTNTKLEMEGRKSFPSGHASTAFSGLHFLTLYLLGRAQIMASRDEKTMKPMAGIINLLKLMLVMTPSLLAAWIAISRRTDNRHHYVDIVTGSVIGIGSASIAYFYNYTGLFTQHAGMTVQAYLEKKNVRSLLLPSVAQCRRRVSLP